MWDGAFGSLLLRAWPEALVCSRRRPLRTGLVENRRAVDCGAVKGGRTTASGSHLGSTGLGCCAHADRHLRILRIPPHLCPDASNCLNSANKKTWASIWGENSQEYYFRQERKICPLRECFSHGFPTTTRKLLTSSRFLVLFCPWVGGQDQTPSLTQGCADTWFVKRRNESSGERGISLQERRRDLQQDLPVCSLPTCCFFFSFSFMPKPSVGK